MDIQFLTIEVGSTITKANGFRLLPEGRFEHLAQGFAPTSVSAGDVRIGVNQAIAELQVQAGEFTHKPEMFVNSSAAGGLRMTVHGLTYNMTAREPVKPPWVPEPSSKRSPPACLTLGTWMRFVSSSRILFSWLVEWTMVRKTLCSKTRKPLPASTCLHQSSMPGIPPSAARYSKSSQNPGVS